MGRLSDIFSLPWQQVQQPIVRWLAKHVYGLAEYALGLSALQRLYLHAQSIQEGTFAWRILNILKVEPQWTAADVERVPASGALVILANHPFGAVEGLALLELIRRRRPDVKVMANYLLGRISELQGDFILVDPFGAAGSARRNVNALRQALQWLKANHALIIFPAGEVASLTRDLLHVRDAPWHPSVMALIRHSGAKTHILPVFIPGKASLLFHLAGLIHPRLRTLLLPREMLRLRRHNLPLRVGNALTMGELEMRFPSDHEALRYVRFRTLLLAGREQDASPFDQQMRRLTLDARADSQEPLISPIAPESLAAELDRLPKEALLLEEGHNVLYAAQGHAIPNVLREIGRLRELTFRAAGEGTGRDLDTDDFDAAYYQIILWHRTRREIVGCYRLALSDVFAERDGLHALYTRKLFRFDERFLGHLPGPAIELGRSFVQPHFQRTFAPLLFLWRGVLTFLARHPRYTVLFGSVSISHDFRPATRELLMDYLRTHAFNWTLAQWVSPRLPPKATRFVEWRHPDYAAFLESESDINAAIAELEEGSREMPVLIRQYLKLGGQIVAFNVDPDFGTVIDGLIVVDLLHASPRAITRYMGKEAYEAYRNASRKE